MMVVSAISGGITLCQREYDFIFIGVVITQIALYMPL